MRVRTGEYKLEGWLGDYFLRPGLTLKMQTSIC